MNLPNFLSLLKVRRDERQEEGQDDKSFFPCFFLSLALYLSRSDCAGLARSLPWIAAQLAIVLILQVYWRLRRRG